MKEIPSNDEFEIDEYDLSNFINDVDTDDEIDLDKLLNGIENDIELDDNYLEETKKIQQKSASLQKTSQNKINIEQSYKDNPEKALKLINELKEEVVRFPSNYKLRRDYAETLVDLDFLEEALVEFKILLNIFNNDPSIFFSIGFIHDKLDEFAQAKSYYEKASELSPEEPDYHYNLAFLLDRNGKLNEAILEYEKTLELDPDDQHSHFNLGCLYSKQNKYEKAIIHLKTAVNLNNEDVYAHYNLAYAYKKTGEINKALTGYNRVLEIKPNYSWAYFNIGCIYYETGKIEESINFFEKVIEINPKDVAALSTAVTVLLKNKEYNRALHNLENGLINNPNYGEIYYLMAQVYKAQGYINEATELLHKALENHISLYTRKFKVKTEYDELKKLIS